MFSRMPAIPAEALTAEQWEAVAAFKASRGSEPFGPFVPLLRSPELMTRVSALGQYLRFNSALPPRLSEFVILVTAAHWRESFEWDLHARIAMKAGLDLTTIKAIADLRRPAGLTEEEAVLYDLCREVHERRPVSASVYERSVAVLGEQKVIDAVGLCGYYSMLAMVLHTASDAGAAAAELKLPVP